MAIKAKTLLANRKNYGNKRSLSTIRYIVIHYTANNGDHDENNANYFSKNVVKASAHYFIDDDSYTKSVPLSYVAWSVGGRNTRIVARLEVENTMASAQMQTPSISSCVTL